MRVIAEIGISHNGNMYAIDEMLDLSKKLGCIPKFQFYDTDRLFNKDFKYYEDSRKSMLSKPDIKSIARQARQIGVPWFASVFHPDYVVMSEKLDMPMYKVASMSVTDEPLLRCIAETEKPVIMSTGNHDQAAVDQAVEILKSNALTLMYCVPKYPAKVIDYDIGNIQRMKDRYGLPVGVSDHCIGFEVGIKANQLDCPFYEHHITLSREKYQNCDAPCSWEPNELVKFMEMI